MREPKLFAGARLKRLRRDLKLTQVKMAKELGVSASYLNLMERNQRPVTAQVLIRLVETYDLDLGMFAAGPDQRTFLALREAVSDPVLASLGLDDHDLRELSEVHPLGAQALVKLHRAYRSVSHAAAGLSEQLSGDSLQTKAGQRPQEIVREITQQNEGYFAEVEEAAELFCDEIRLDRLDVFSTLTARLQQLHSIRTRILPEQVLRHHQRRFDRHSRRLLLSDLLNITERSFHLAVQIAHLELRDLMDEKCQHPDLLQAGHQAVQLYRETMARYFAMAVLLPYDQVLEQAEASGYDVQVLAAKFGVSIELMARRLACLRRPEALGLPLFLLRFDQAGAVVERFGAKSFGLSKFGGSCPKWNVWQVSANAPNPVIDFVEMTGGEHLLSIAFASNRLDPLGEDFCYSQIIVLGCAANRAMETIYGRRLGEAREMTPRKIGPGCRICEQKHCAQRSNSALFLATASQNERIELSLLGSSWNGVS